MTATLELLAAVALLFAVSAAFLRDAYSIRRHYHAELFNKLTERRYSLIYVPSSDAWIVTGPYSTSQIVACHHRWQIAVQSALAEPRPTGRRELRAVTRNK